ncbi:MAG: hypothetical protein F2793_05425 [Actinobacteria bacterium]|uniref:Unannotated protein n=1 Tax=freshwater metagenome TaxID=449393 RepID=A0A6J7E5T5_9ZZZZ|nr:hypothetical protein [Actinomycetota bacterium]
MNSLGRAVFAFSLSIGCLVVSPALTADAVGTAEPAIGAVDCRTINPEPGMDFSHCDLSGADFSGANLSYANLTSANLTHADLSGAILLGVSAGDVTLSSANLAGAALIDADLAGARLRGANLLGATATSANLAGADLDGAVLSGATFAGADLTDADLDGAKVDGTIFTGADLTRVGANLVDFSGAVLTGAVLTGADLTSARLSGLDLSGTDLSRADLTGARLIRTNLTDASVSRANLTDATLRGSTLTRMGQAGATWWNTTCPDGAVTTGAPCPEGRTANEAAFIPVGPIDYWFHKSFLAFTKDIRYTTTPVRLFTTFQPADGVDPTTAPLFVMLNGGPGAATTANLFANNTAQFTENADAVGAGGLGYVANPNSWTSFANLLYIDPPQTGFSYSINGAAATDDVARLKDYLFHGNFNAFIDADQVLRVVLAFLDSHPDLADNPVVLVGESYGGTRVSVMMNMLLFSGRYDANGPSFFRDPELVSLIRAHFALVGDGRSPTPTLVARQFSRQILIQPQLTSYQSDVQSTMFWKKSPSIIDEVAIDAQWQGGFTRDAGLCTFPLNVNLGACALMKYVAAWDRDRYNWKKAADWTDNQEALTSVQFDSIGKLNTILGVDVRTVPGFASDQRKDAYHLLSGLLGVGPDGIASAAGSPDLPEQAGPMQDALADGFAPGPYYDALVATQRRTDAAVRAADTTMSLQDYFGPLGRYDRYYMAWNPEVYLAFTYNVVAPEYVLLPINPENDATYGEMFLENARFVSTFLTDAQYDLVIYSPALPAALAMHTGTVRGVNRVRATGAGSGTFVITYRDGVQASLTYPFYAESGHAVAAVEPKKLHDDIAAWLTVTPLPTGAPSGG